jgi:hypothetical protein
MDRFIEGCMANRNSGMQAKKPIRGKKTNTGWRNELNGGTPRQNARPATIGIQNRFFAL